MLKYDFEGSVGYWVLSAANEYQRAVNVELAPHGITYRQAQVLGWLALDGDLSQSELVDRMQVEPPTVVGILDRLERMGWVTRDCDPIDRRRKVIRVTEAAEPAWEKIVAAALKVREKAVAGISFAELETLRELLGRLRDNLKESLKESVPAPRHELSAAPR